MPHTAAHAGVYGEAPTIIVIAGASPVLDR